ncbi:MAG TPA: TIGR03435 family protein [Acidobacteriaceae bacterium]|nr:TIGR03435 family protein [Acidobacteriaceae bacterium]
MRIRPVALILAAAALAPLADAQTTPAPPASALPAKPLAFEVVTIKPDTNGRGWALQPTPDGYRGVNISLYKLVQEAYGIFDSKLVLGGPAWIDSEKFDLEAKFDPAAVPSAKDLNYRQRADMLRAVLADRFQLKVHFVKKDFPAYNLVVAEGGPKLTETPPDKVAMTVSGPSCLHKRGGVGLEQLEGCTMGALADSLRYPSGRTVIDKTGLTGRYSFELHWTPDNTPADSPLADSSAPSIFTAVQEQLGLKLSPSTAPLDVLVIDSASRPSEN